MTLAPGARLLQYEIVASIGAGGMGEVYRAHDSRLGRDVAIKVLSEHLATNPDMQARFEREARAVAALSHPGILAIHELAQVDGRAVAVMELLEGENLRARMTHGPLDWRMAAELGVQIAEALSAAHLRGIIHRDLKPENIFVMPDGRPKILDFGLAHTTEPMLGGKGDGETAVTMGLTQPGHLLGTVGYMAPEQVRGETAGPPTDLFALGCVLAEMVTGHRPFGRPTPAESIAAILSEPPPDLSAVAGLPAGYADIVTHCLAKNARDRFQSAMDVQQALRSLLVDSAASMTGGSAISAVGGVKKKPRRPGKALAVLPFASSGTDPGTEYLADGIAEAITNSLSQLPKLRVVPRSLAFRYKGRDTDFKSVALALNARSLVTGRVVQQGSTVTIQVELIDCETETQLWGEQFRHPVTEILAVQEEIASRISEALSLRLSGEDRRRLKRRPTSNSDAYQDYLRGRYHWSKWNPEDFRKAIEYFERAIAQDPTYALAYSGLGDTYGALSYYGFIPPDVAMPRARAAAARAQSLDPSLGEAHTTMGLAHMMFDWDFPAAGREFRRGVELNPKSATAHTFYGLFEASLGRFDRALELVRRGCDIDPLTPLIQVGPAWVLYFAHRFQEAIDHLRQLMLVHQEWPEAANVLVFNYELRGEFERAADMIEQGGAAFCFPDGASTFLKKAYAEGGPRGYWEGRLRLFEQTPQPRRIPEYLYALLYGQLGRLDEAFDWLEKAVAARNGPVCFMKVDPGIDPLRADPRFRAILEKIMPTAETV